MAVEIFAPFMSPYEFFEGMGIRIWENGHAHTGVSTSIHADYSAVPGYFDKMVEAYGEKRAKAILDENRHNTVYFPNLMVKGPIQLLRLFKPIAANKTLAESWTFRLVDAPDLLLERTLMYNRLINAPTSVVGHDDLEMYERAQEGLHSDGNPWVNLQRLYHPGEARERNVVTNGTSEWPMRNQFRAWAHFMTMTARWSAEHERLPFRRRSPRLRLSRGAPDRSASFRGMARPSTPTTATTGCRSNGARPIRGSPRSLMYEDKMLLGIRVERLKGNRTFSQKPKSRCHHVLQAPQIESRDEAANRYVVWTPMHYVETRLDEQTLYAAWATHTLAVEDGALKIKLKRVDLVNCDAAFGNIQLVHVRLAVSQRGRNGGQQRDRRGHRARADRARPRSDFAFVETSEMERRAAQFGRGRSDRCRGDAPRGCGNRRRA